MHTGTAKGKRGQPLLPALQSCMRIKEQQTLMVTWARSRVKDRGFQPWLFVTLNKLINHSRPQFPHP